MHTKNLEKKKIPQYTLRNKKLKKKIGNEKVIVDFAMRCGNPSIELSLLWMKDVKNNNSMIISSICSRN